MCRLGAGRFDRRRLLILDSVVRAAAFASIPIGLIGGPLDPVHRYVVAAVYGSLKMLPLAGFPAQTLRMRLVPAAEHGRLFALLRTAMQATYPLGASLAALSLGHGTTVTVLAAAAFMGLPVLLTVRSGRHVGWLHAADVSDRRADAGQRPTGRRQL